MRALMATTGSRVGAVGRPTEGEPRLGTARSMRVGRAKPGAHATFRFHRAVTHGAAGGDSDFPAGTSRDSDDEDGVGGSAVETDGPSEDGGVGAGGAQA